MPDDKEGPAIESHGILGRLAYFAKTESLATLILAFVSFIAASTAFLTFYITAKKEQTDAILIIQRLAETKEELENVRSFQITVSSTRTNLDELSEKSAILTASMSDIATTFSNLPDSQQRTEILSKIIAASQLVSGLTLTVVSHGG